MGIFDAFKRLIGGAPSSAPERFKHLSDEELMRLWRAKDALPTATVLGVRDEHLRRLLPLPPVDLPSLYSPPVAGLTDEEDAESTLELVSEYDPKTSTLGRLTIGAVSALLTVDDGVLLILFRGWRTSTTLDDAVPTVPEGQTLSAVFAVDPDVDLAPFRAQGIPCHGDHEAPFTDPVTVKGVTALPHVTYPKVLHVQDEEGLVYLFGANVPLAVVEEEPDYIVGGLSIPKDTESLEAIAESWSPHDAALNVEQVILLPEVEGVDGLHAGEFSRSLGFAPRIRVRGQLITAAAQPLVDAAERCAWDEVPALAESLEPTALDEAFRVLVVDGRLDDARTLIETVPRDGARGTYLLGVLSQFGGEMPAARAAYEEAVQGDEPVSGAQCQLASLLAAEGQWDAALTYASAGSETRIGDPIAAANHAMAAWYTGAHDEAQEVLEETQTTARSWLGAMLDAMLADTPSEYTPTLLSVAGTHVGPYASALEALRGGRSEEAERLLECCLSLAPIHPGAMAHLALHLAAEGRSEEALVRCSEWTKAAPHHVFLGSIHGWLLMHASRFEEAVAAYEGIIAMSGDHGDWWINLTLAQVAVGDSAGAERTIAALEDHVRDMELIATLRRTARDAA
ncbi:MAG: tetratricopeptide repeat protein [Myxococcota bacterium]